MDVIALRFRLDGAVLPPVTAALSVGELFCRAVLGALSTVLGGHPDAFVAHEADGRPRQGPHEHPFYLTEDADGDGGIDHLILHVPRGLTTAEAFMLTNAQPLLGEGPLPRCRLVQAWAGRPGRDAPGRLLSSATVWRSATSYVANVHLDMRFGPADALRRELGQRGLMARAMQMSGPQDFVVRRHQNCAKPASRSGHPGAWFTLEFVEPVVGPLALGFGCHLGLGTFRGA